MDVIVERCAGLDVHKKTVMAAVRAPRPAGPGRRQEVKEFSTFTGDLQRLREWLVAEGVTQVAMEATGAYWRPVGHVLEAVAGVELLLVNPRHVKNLPDRKTDVGDAAWLAQLLECGLLRGSFVPPKGDRPPAGPDALPDQADPRTGPGDPAHPEAARRRRRQVGLGGH
ncbi:MAG: transposase [Acidimicrobiales bacterium]